MFLTSTINVDIKKHLVFSIRTFYEWVMAIKILLIRKLDIKCMNSECIRLTANCNIPLYAIYINHELIHKYCARVVMKLYWRYPPVAHSEQRACLLVLIKYMSMDISFIEWMMRLQSRTIYVLTIFPSSDFCFSHTYNGKRYISAFFSTYKLY